MGVAGGWRLEIPMPRHQWLRAWFSKRPLTNQAYPLQFWNSIQMAVLFQIVLYLMHWFQERFGDQGLLTSGAILGLTNMDALTLSMARGIQTTDWSLASKALSIGILSNTLLKAVIAIFVGEGRFRWLTAAGLCAIGAGVLISIFLF